MASRRMISASIFEDEFFGELSMFERLLWIGLFSACADDQGRFSANPAVIRSKIFPYDDVKLSDITRGIEHFSEAGKLHQYEAEGKNLCQFITWWTYQTPAWAMPSKMPAPKGWQDRAKYHKTPEKVITLNWDKAGGFSNELPSEPDEQQPNVLHSGLSRGIDELRRDKDDGEEDEEISRDTTTTIENEEKLSEVVQSYQENIGVISPVIADLLKIATEQYPPGWIPDAIDEAVKNNVRKWSYIDAILKNWETNGRNGVKKKKQPKERAGSDYISGQYAHLIEH